MKNTKGDSSYLEGVAGAFFVLVSLDLLLSFEVGFFFLGLKSVSYQPEPLKRKAAAVIFFFKYGFPHALQSVRGSSLIFWMTSINSSQD